MGEFLLELWKSPSDILTFEHSRYSQDETSHIIEKYFNFNKVTKSIETAAEKQSTDSS